jgi:polyhydroxyalkanoate synthase
MGDRPGFDCVRIPWVNPDENSPTRTSSYLTEHAGGLSAVEKAKRRKEVNAIGYRLGGTLLAATLAYMAPPRTAESSAAIHDVACRFHAGGASSSVHRRRPGGIPERKMASAAISKAARWRTRSTCCANDLIWSFVINNYPLGRDRFRSTSCIELGRDADARDDAFICAICT